MSSTSAPPILHYDAFATTPGMGNPAGVILDAAALTDAQMQAIAARVGFNETAFVLPSARGDLCLRFFTPGHEVPLCGHATVGSLVALHDHGLLPPRPDLRIETGAGLLPIAVLARAGAPPLIEMTQLPAEFVPFAGDTAALAASLGLAAADLAPDLPLLYGSTGLWTLVVPVRDLDAMRRMRPDNARFPAILTAMPRASVHPVCLATLDPAAHLHARHFSSPYSGTIEDPVTGTASGVLAAYCALHGPPSHRRLDFTVEQGQEIGRDGRVLVALTPHGDTYLPRIAGTAVFVGEIAANPAS